MSEGEVLDLVHFFVQMLCFHDRKWVFQLAALELLHEDSAGIGNQNRGLPEKYGAEHEILTLLFGCDSHASQILETCTGSE